MSFSGMRRTGAFPGIDDARFTIEIEMTWGHWEVNSSHLMARIIDSTAVDTGHTGLTNILRPGLAMGTITATGKALPWLVGAADGSQLFSAFLLETIDMNDSSGTPVDRFTGSLLFMGQVKASAVQLSVETTRGLVGATDEAAFRALANVTNHIKFDDFDL